MSSKAYLDLLAGFREIAEKHLDVEKDVICTIDKLLAEERALSSCEGNMKSIIEFLLQKEKGLVFLSAPSKGGKTKLLETLKIFKPEAKIISGEEFVESVVEPILMKGQRTKLNALYEQTLLCIEDMDWYENRTQTQYELARELSSLSEKRMVIVTGIDLRNRMNPMFSKLKQYDFFEKINTTDE